MAYRAVVDGAESVDDLGTGPGPGTGLGTESPDAAETTAAPQSVASRAFHSWLSMKTGVMIWLWYLNVLYWVAFFQSGHPEAFWAAISYVAVGPILVPMVWWQRGLTRLTGLIHLPWVPFTGYLGLRLFTDVLGPASSMADGAFFHLWLHGLFWSTLICVGFDVIDVIRWLAGERYVLGSPAAYAAGASKLARRELTSTRRGPAS